MLYAEPARTSNAGIYIDERWCGGHMERRDWSASLIDDYSPSLGASYVREGAPGIRRQVLRAVGSRRYAQGDRPRRHLMASQHIICIFYMFL